MGLLCDGLVAFLDLGLILRSTGVSACLYQLGGCVALLSGSLRLGTLPVSVRCEVILQLGCQLVHKLVLDFFGIGDLLLAGCSGLTTRRLDSRHGDWLNYQTLLRFLTGHNFFVLFSL